MYGAIGLARHRVTDVTDVTDVTGSAEDLAPRCRSWLELCSKLFANDIGTYHDIYKYKYIYIYTYLVGGFNPSLKNMSQLG